MVSKDGGEPMRRVLIGAVLLVAAGVPCASLLLAQSPAAGGASPAPAFEVASVKPNKLESTKGPVDVLVIDRAEKPSED